MTAKQRTVFDTIIGDVRMVIVLGDRRVYERAKLELEYFVGSQTEPGELAEVSRDDFRLLIDAMRMADASSVASALEEIDTNAIAAIADELDPKQGDSFARQLLTKLEWIGEVITNR